ncbi:MAG TPA: PilZ domain-containing protein [Gemmataceae bacterium]|nr:PilZ domain-containing protein [Gemmataceae bacterium]
MFERTMSFWKRLLGRHPAAEDGASVKQAEEDRRVWVRYPADLPTTYQPASKEETVRLTARVRNVSLGGVSLAVDRPFQPGEMLSVELPGATDESRCKVLACVVHLTPVGGSEWILGCTFSRELSQEDLEAFGARRERHSSSDQRTWMRFTCDVKAQYQPIGGPETAPQNAKVINLSASGVGLLVPRSIDNGALLSVELQAASGSFRRTMLACVVHVTAQPESEWALGCNFIRSLSDEDLQALL